MDRQSSELTWSYDKDADVLYLSFGEPKAAYGDHLGDDVILLYSLEDEALVGLTIIGFREMGGIDGLLDRLSGFVAALRIPLLTAHAEELRQTAASEAVPG